MGDTQGQYMWEKVFIEMGKHPTQEMKKVAKRLHNSAEYRSTDMSEEEFDEDTRVAMRKLGLNPRSFDDDEDA